MRSINPFVPFVLSVLFVFTFVPNASAAQLPASPQDTPPNDTIDQLLTRLALAEIPARYEDTKKWGSQAERWNGIRFELDDGRLETRRKRKTVNHGTWQRYALSLRNPEQEFHIKIRNQRELSDHKIGFEIHADAHIDFEGQQVEWKKGVKLYSLSVEGHAVVQIQINMELEIEVTPFQFPPDIVLKPKVARSVITVDQFRIDRIGKVGGEIAQQLGKETQRRITQNMSEYELKLTGKINQQFSKKEDGYRFSISETKKSKWADTLSKFVGG